MLDAYDFSNVATLMDVGGGGGTLIAATLQRHASMRGVLFDLDHVVDRARTHLVQCGVDDRCDVVGGNFFESVPTGADAIVMRHIVHDYLDEDAVRILSNCHAALPNNGRILLVEAVIPPGNDPSPSKVMDMAMMLYPGGMERTADECDLVPRLGIRTTGGCHADVVDGECDRRSSHLTNASGG